VRELTEKDIIQIIREEYDRKLCRILSEVETSPFPGQADEKEPIITPNLKVRHEKTGFLYTVDSVSQKDVVLRSPEGDRFTVEIDEFEREYELD